jgi:hypothetical protein
MAIMNHIDATADIACTLPINEVGERLNSLQALIGDHLDTVSRDGDRLQIRIARAGRADLETEVSRWAEAEKACCAFLRFAVESEPEVVLLEIAALGGAEPTLDALEWLVQAAGRKYGAA